MHQLPISITKSNYSLFNPINFLKKVKQKQKTEKRFVRFVFSRFLRMTKLCCLFKIKLAGYSLHFFPTALSATLWVDSTDRIDDQETIMALLDKGDCFVDVGANIGLLSIIAAKKIGKDGIVYAFEPHKKIFYYFEKNLKLNLLKNVKAYQFAIGEKCQTVSFSDSYSDDQNKIIFEGKNVIQMVTLDSIIDIKQQIALLKIDVEGFEKFVFYGAKKTLNNVNAVYFESSDILYKNYNYSLKDIFMILSEYKYKIFVVNKLTLTEYKDSDLTSHSNLLAIKQEFVPKIIKKFKIM